MIKKEIRIIFYIYFANSYNIMSVKVAVRVRPFNQRQKFLGCLNCIQMKDKTTILINPRDRSQKQHQFTFDYSFWSHDGFEELENGYLYPIDDRFVDQKKIFKELGEEILRNAWNGFNCCLFAYGQTGAGKSYSMIGYETNRGIVPMACQKIFEGIERNRIKGKKQFQLTLSMLEIYNQKVQDLFVHTSKRPVNGLRIRQSKKTGVYVQGITRYEVHSYAEIERRMEEGAKNRSLASTLMNQYSSRAHTIVIIEFVQKEFITQQKMNKKTSMLNLVDLAGSERVAKTGISDKDRLKQASQINKSLHTLGRVIEHLAEQASDKGKIVQIPYRQSALTRILETALGGNSVTTMICAISPANDNYEETLSTLRYADQTKKIKNKPIINESAVDKIIRELRQENQRLKEMLRIAKLKGINLQDQNGNIFANIQQIQRQIRKNMQSFAINTDGLDDQEDQSMEISQFIDVPDPNDFYSGELSFDNINNSSTTTVGNARANAFITNLSEDRLLSFKIKYSCEEELYVGNKNLKEGGRNKLVLCGLGIQDRHARLYEINGKYFIEALSDQAGQYTLVNGRPVEKRVEIRHNDRIIFGTNSVFLFKNFNQKGVKSPEKKGATNVGVGGLQGSGKSVGKTGTSTGVGVGISIGTDDMNESMLIDWQDDQKPKQKAPLKTTSNVSIETDPYDEQLDQKLIDYQFAVAERQNKMFQTSSLSGSSSSYTYGYNSGNKLQSGIGKNQMVSKLEQIEKQFQEMKKQNERKMKEKEEEFRMQLKQMQIQKQIQKAKLKEQLKTKEQEAKKIHNQKERIERIRDKLLEIQKQRKEKQKKLRESMLLGDQDGEGQQGYAKIQFQEVPTPTGNHNKKKGMVSIGQTQIIATSAPSKSPSQNQPQHKVQYIDQHHFHYDFNVIHNGGTQSQSSKTNQQLKYDPSPSVNTTSTTNLNAHNDHDESMLLDAGDLIRKEEIKEVEKKVKKELKCQNVFNLNEVPVGQPAQQNGNGSQKSAQDKEEKKQRKRSLNMTDILYDIGPTNRARKGSKSSRKSSGRQDEEQNLLNMTDDAQILASYIPPQPSDDITNKREGFQNVSLNLSDDMSLHYALREEELLDKIKEYEEKLRNLEQSAQEKKESIKNIRKSFAVQFGQNPSSDNFYSQQNLFEGELDFSLIETRKNSADIAQNSELQRKIKDNMIQCQNQNIINQRSLQVRKRKREAQQLKQAFIKKQKKELQKQLVQLIPMLQKFNLWAREMNRNLQGKVQIEYHNFTNYQIIDALKSTMKGKIGIHIKIYNFQEGRTYKWPVDIFRNRFEIAENLFQRFLENPTNDLFADKSKDPFWDPRDFVPYAVGYLSLEPLSYALDFQGEVTLVYKGQIIGYLDVILEPAFNRQTKKLRNKITEQTQNENQIYDPRQLLQQDLCFTISIQKFRPTEHLPSQKIQKFYISYDLLQDSYHTETYKTQQISISKKQIGYMLKHSLHNVTEHTLAYLADSPICLTLNLLFHYDEEMSNMTSSFIQNQSSLNLSTLSDKMCKSELKSEVGSSDSPPSFVKKKSAAIIIENPDILPKIEKEYTTEQKRIRQRAETIQGNSSSNNKKKDKEKGKQECTIF